MQHGMKQPMLRVTTPSPAYIGVRLTYKTGATALLWGMSAMPDCTDLPDDPTALARIAVNGSESQDLRNAAWQKLIPIINRIAIDAARAYHCQEIEQEAVGYIWQKLQEGKFEPEKGRFDAWASVVLHHLAADLRKQFSRRLLHSAQQIDSLIEEIPDGRATGTGAAGDAFAQQLDRLRREFDRLSHLLPCETNGVAYFAVFLLQLRLAMARRASQAGFSDPICHSDFIAECLPWHREEGELRFRLGCLRCPRFGSHLPTLGPAASLDHRNEAVRRAYTCIWRIIAYRAGCLGPVGHACRAGSPGMAVPAMRNLTDL